jgi:hypothetical protein
LVTPVARQKGSQNEFDFPVGPCMIISHGPRIEDSKGNTTA